MYPPSRRRYRVLLARVVAARLRRVTIEGSSMEPVLVAGDRLVVVAALTVRVGDIVALADPRDGRLLVKRVKSVDHRQQLVSVEGDNNRHSTDSRVFGPVRRDDIIGRAIYRYAPPARVGRVGARR
jgi:phage repressor protein C with HTH and peptisase S24 domain